MINNEEFSYAGMGQGSLFRKLYRTVDQVQRQGFPNVWTPELVAQLTPETVAKLDVEQKEAIARSIGLEPARRALDPFAIPRGSSWADIAAAQAPIAVDLGPAVPLMPGGIMAPPGSLGPAQAGIFGKPAFWLGSLALGGLLLFLAKTNNGGRARPRRR